MDPEHYDFLIPIIMICWSRSLWFADTEHYDLLITNIMIWFPGVKMIFVFGRPSNAIIDIEYIWLIIINVIQQIN